MLTSTMRNRLLVIFHYLIASVEKYNNHENVYIWPINLEDGTTNNFFP